MKKKFIVLLLIIALVIVGCSSKDEEEKDTVAVGDEQTDEIGEKVEKTMQDMTLDEKIGQMIIVAYRSPKIDDTLKSALSEVQPGGFILFSENITSYENTLNYIKEIKNYVEIPMFISIDQEGGIVQRLKSLTDYKASDIPSMYYLGLKDDEELTYDVGKLIAEELRVLGVNMDFAPVIDVFSNPKNTVIGKRSFGTTSEIVSKHGLSLAKGLEDNGVIAVYKHFPGHGNTAVDSHVDLPVVDKTKEKLMELDLVPFVDAINNDAKVIMVGHLAVPNISNDNTPASLSKTLITDFLKGELNYNGLVVTDALNMGALTKYYSNDELCGKAVEAGVDLLLMPSSSRTCLKSVKDAINKGIIDEETINRSVEKILRLKYENIVDNYDEYLPVSYLNSKEHQEIISKIQ